MFELENLTPFSMSASTFPDPEGVDAVYIIVQASFMVGEAWGLVSPQPELQVDDLYIGKPAQSSLIFPSPVHHTKPATDILMVGSAYAPEGVSVGRMKVAIGLCPIQKTLIVTGDRVWKNGVPSAPIPFSVMPVVYERAYGGGVENEEKLDVLEENPIGVGFLADRSTLDMDGEFLPNIEYPNQLMSALDDQPTPAGFGALLPHWMPRRQYAGSYNDQWQQMRSPFFPVDFDVRFFNSAPADQVYPGYIQGGEELCIEGMHPQGAIRAHLPRIQLSCTIFAEQREVQCPVIMETVLLEPNKKQVMFSWKAAHRCDKSLQKIEKIKLSLLR